MDTVTVRNTCRVCGHEAPPLDLILSLGACYISDFPLTPTGHDHPAVPLELMRCPKCTLVQLRHTTPPAWMYTRYWYRSSINESMVAALGDIVTKARAMVPVAANDVVIDIGANDGTLLSWYPKTGPCPVRMAFEPAANLYDALRPHTDVLFRDFFTARPLELVKQKAKIVTSIACFYDLERPNDFVADVKKILHPEGVWIIELSYLPSMLKQAAFDTICHEHLEYYTLRSLQFLLARHDLVVADVETNDVNGGSFRCYVRHVAAWESLRHWDGDYRVAQLQVAEDLAGYQTAEPFKDFTWRVNEIKKHVLAAIDRVLASGGTVDVYGASTKGNTLLQVWGLGPDRIRQALERSPEKWGRYTIGTGIPIVSEEQGREDPATMLLVPIWHFRDAILAREADYFAAGGSMLFPLPAAEIVFTAQQRSA